MCAVSVLTAICWCSNTVWWKLTSTGRLRSVSVWQQLAWLAVRMANNPVFNDQVYSILFEQKIDSVTTKLEWDLDWNIIMNRVRVLASFLFPSEMPWNKPVQLHSSSCSSFALDLMIWFSPACWQWGASAIILYGLGWTQRKELKLYGFHPCVRRELNSEAIWGLDRPILGPSRLQVWWLRPGELHDRGGIASPIRSSAAVEHPHLRP